MRTRIHRGLIMVITLASAFCGRTPPAGAPEPAEPTMLAVENQSTLRVTVYVLRDSQRRRLGVADALTTTHLRIPRNLIFGPTSLRFEVDPLGSRQTPISHQIIVNPGDKVTLRIPPTIR